MSRALIATAIFTLVALASPAFAQAPAIDQQVPLKFIAADDESASFAQIPARGRAPDGATYDSWVWTFMRTPQGQGTSSWNMAAVQTRFDCQTGTHRRMRYEFYLDEVPSGTASRDEAPTVPGPDTIMDGALRTVCDPSYRSSQVVVDGARGLREIMDDYFATR